MMQSNIKFFVYEPGQLKTLLNRRSDVTELTEVSHRRDRV